MLKGVDENAIFAAKGDSSGIPSSDWIGGWQLGRGAQGIVNAWVRVDESGNIIDRMAIKDCWSRASTEEPDNYRGIYEDLVSKGLDFGVATSGSPGGALPEERFFKEAYVQGLLTARPGEAPTNTVPLRGYKKGDKSGTSGTHWRTYMDYLDSGNLHNLIGNHGGKDSRGFLVEDPIPEPFIWWTLICFANALIQMEQRARTRPQARDEQDEVIVAMDLKPENIIFAPPGGSQFPVYPEALITDFGSANLTFKTDGANVDNTIESQTTPCFHASEMRRKVNQFSIEQKRGFDAVLYSWTNVWQVGRIIECMMRKKQRMPDWDYWNKFKPRESQILELPPRHASKPGFEYSDELKEIVWRCQRYDPKLRPTPMELQEFLELHAAKHCHGMRDWGTEPWISEMKARKRSDTPMATASAPAPEKLKFLDQWLNQHQADEYRKLNMDLPEGCELKYCIPAKDASWKFKHGLQMRKKDGKLATQLAYKVEGGKVVPGFSDRLPAL